ncbi:hypothetical protein EV182_007382 [Spiromyces aspiralis]|uniref:Uncharacterized protein n=1 Tax=Spiromyces aspiralis TaxID=68401 RepID=A0ACC1HKJ3_9FUNG|nr:hypothetical protein EV182_007382 [Spiromyces aspiralis]
MSWGGHPVYDCPAEFRIEFWRASKLAELDADIKAKSNSIRPDSDLINYKFVAAPVVSCRPSALAEILRSQGLQQGGEAPDPSANIGGLLLVHRQAHYTPGTSPLSCWVPREAIPALIDSLQQSTPQ